MWQAHRQVKLSDVTCQLETYPLRSSTSLWCFLLLPLPFSFGQELLELDGLLWQLSISVSTRPDLFQQSWTVLWEVVVKPFRHDYSRRTSHEWIPGSPVQFHHPLMETNELELVPYPDSPTLPQEEQAPNITYPPNAYLRRPVRDVA